MHKDKVDAVDAWLQAQLQEGAGGTSHCLLITGGSCMCDQASTWTWSAVIWPLFPRWTVTPGRQGWGSHVCLCVHEYDGALPAHHERTFRRGLVGPAIACSSQVE